MYLNMLHNIKQCLLSNVDIAPLKVADAITTIVAIVSGTYHEMESEFP
ncbi:hypothetical protein [Methanobrevibacter sp.]|nr:hypothetical protein [Methanobrevibacter sp.]